MIGERGWAQERARRRAHGRRVLNILAIAATALFALALAIEWGPR